MIESFVMVCLQNFISNRGYFCSVDAHKAPVVKYYEPGKSCYVNGTFYTKCEDGLNGTK